MNNKGYVPLQVFLIVALVSGLSTAGFVKTSQDGTLKKNGKLIWCKMQNKGNNFCDAKYR